MQRWFLDFDPLSIGLVWVRIPNLPLHLWSSDSLNSIRNSLGRKFIKNDTERISKGLATFAQICVELELSKGFPDKISINLGGFNPTCNSLITNIEPSDVDLVINLDTFKRSALFPGPFWAKAVKRLERLKKKKK